MDIPVIVETERLILRKPIIDDAQAVYTTYATDPDVTKYLTWKPHDSVETTKIVLNSFLKGWDEKTEFSFMIVIRDTDTLIGNITLRVDAHGGNVGYVLGKNHWNKGYMTEALEAIVQMALQQKNIYRVWAVHDVENEASGKVLEKAGMRYEGILYKWLISPNIGQVPRDCKCYSIVKD